MYVYIYIYMCVYILSDVCKRVLKSTHFGNQYLINEP